MASTETFPRERWTVLPALPLLWHRMWSTHVQEYATLYRLHRADVTEAIVRKEQPSLSNVRVAALAALEEAVSLLTCAQVSTLLQSNCLFAIHTCEGQLLK